MNLRDHLLLIDLPGLAGGLEAGQTEAWHAFGPLDGSFRRLIRVTQTQTQTQSKSGQRESIFKHMKPKSCIMHPSQLADSQEVNSES